MPTGFRFIGHIPIQQCISTRTFHFSHEINSILDDLN